jgi:hypothetical protein
MLEPNLEELQARGLGSATRASGLRASLHNFYRQLCRLGTRQRARRYQGDERLPSQTFRRPASGPPARGFLSIRTLYARPHAPRRLTHSNRRSFTDALDRLRSVRSTWAIYLGEAHRRVRRRKVDPLTSNASALSEIAFDEHSRRMQDGLRGACILRHT